MIRRLSIVLLVIAGIVFAPYFIGILINRITWLDVELDVGGADSNFVVWLYGFVGGFAIVLCSMVVIPLLLKAIDYIVKGK